MLADQLRFPINVGFTGTSVGMRRAQRVSVTRVLEEFLLSNKIIAVHHGDCVGADEECDEICRAMGLQRAIHPPILEHSRAFCDRFQSDMVTLLPPDDFLKRNATIVMAAQVVVAAPRSEEFLRSGTWATVRRARQMRRPLVICMPDGERRVEQP